MWHKWYYSLKMSVLYVIILIYLRASSLQCVEISTACRVKAKKACFVAWSIEGSREPCMCALRCSTAQLSSSSSSAIGQIWVLRNVSMHTGKPQVKQMHTEATYVRPYPTRRAKGIRSELWPAKARLVFSVPCSRKSRLRSSLAEKIFAEGTGPTGALDSSEFPVQSRPGGLASSAA